MLADIDISNSVKFNGCNVEIERKFYRTSNGDSHPPVIWKMKFKLDNINGVKTSLYQDGKELRNGSPFSSVKLTSANDSILRESIVSSGALFRDNDRSMQFGTKTLEQATRLTNAFERAVQLCGGHVSSDSGKPEPF